MNKPKVTKAVIAAAGLGTRFLPQTKAMPKEMLPMLDKPIIQWIVEELVDVGVTDIIIVTGTTKRAIEDHFDRSIELEQALKKKGKEEKAAQIKKIAEAANFIYIRQKGEFYGNAVPIMNAAHMIGDEPFFYLSADDLVLGPTSRAAQMLEAYQKTGGSVVSVFKVDKKDSAKYGMAKVGQEVDDTIFKLEALVEKPEPVDAPSDYMVIMSYLLTPDYLKHLKRLKPDRGNELWAADAVNMLCEEGNVYGKVMEGVYHDCGNYLSYLKAQLHYAIRHTDLDDQLADYVQEIVEAENK